MKILLSDIASLQLYVERGCKDMHDRNAFPDPQTFIRLREAGLIMCNGKVSDSVKAKLDKIGSSVEKLKEGIPWDNLRPLIPYYRSMLMCKNPWLTVEYQGNKFCGNGEILYIGSPLKDMFSKSSTKEFKQKVFPTIIKDCLKGSWRNVYPHTYQISNLGKIELLWLSDKDQDVFIPIQSKYMDFVFYKFRSGKFKTRSDGLIKVEVVNKKRGFEGAMCWIMPFEISERSNISRPKIREGWLDGGKKNTN